MANKPGQKARDKQFHNQLGKCYYCDFPMGEKPGNIANPFGVSLEHLYMRGNPLRGSPNSLVAAHYYCNALEAGHNLK